MRATSWELTRVAAGCGCDDVRKELGCNAGEEGRGELLGWHGSPLPEGQTSMARIERDCLACVTGDARWGSRGSGREE